MSRKWKLFLTIAVVVGTFAFFGFLIASNSLIAKYGVEYEFRVMPLDPYDAFRGNYVAINIMDKFPQDVNLETSSFDRYYMDEKYAKAAENLVRHGMVEAYVKIRVLGNRGVVTGLFVDGMRIEDYIIEQRHNQSW